MPQPCRAALLYDDSAYVEALHRPRQPGREAPQGLVGRQVAGREFLEAFVRHGRWDELTAVVYDPAAASSLARFCAAHAGRPLALRSVSVDRFPEEFCAAPPAPVLYAPCPPDPSFAWARLHRRPGAFALCGVTHTLCTAAAARVLCQTVTAPYEEYDALVCTSRAVERMARALAGAYADYLRDRHGGAPRLRPRLEVVPLGVNPDRFRPPTAEERAARRAALHVADGAVAVLFVGRFTPHAKAHPFPLFAGLARAARETGRPAHLILSGWAPTDAVLRAYVDAARTFAPGIPVSVVNGMDPVLRFGAWQAADVFTSLSDSVQETFGLVVVEAMASGLPVVASDWDGYRDLVADGETGLLVPTWMVGGATADASVRLLLQEGNYDAFLAECNQAVAVDVGAAASAYARLLADAGLRRRMGEAGRRRVLERFTWERVVRAYEALWQGQDEQRRRSPASPPPAGGPPCYPAPEVTFAGYPTRLLGQGDRVEAVPGAGAALAQVLAVPLCTYAAERRPAGEGPLRLLLEAAASPRTLAELDEALARRGVPHGPGRAALAWLLKYGLLRPA